MLCVNQLSGFGSRRRVSGGGGGYSFNMTAGTSSGYVGYDTGVLLGTFGSIDAEPIPGQTLQYFITASGDGYISFGGNIVVLLAGLTVWVNGVEYPFDRFDWDYSGGEDATIAEWNTPPIFANGNSYFVEIK